MKKYILAIAAIVLLSIPALTRDVSAGRVVARTRSYSATSSISVRAPSSGEYVEFSESCGPSAAEACDAPQRVLETRSKTRSVRVRNRRSAKPEAGSQCDNN